MAKNSKRWLTVRAQAGASAVTEMVISGPIGKSWWDDSGTSSKEFREQLALIPRGQKVKVRINSEGGSVSDALEIYNVIQERMEDVTCQVDGYALSSASIIAIAGGSTVCPHSSILMIHEPWSMTIGDEADHKKAAEMLSKHGDTLAAIYSKKTGKPVAEMREAMRVETWFTGEEAVDFKLADRTTGDPVDDDDGIEDALAKFRNVPESILQRFTAAAMASAKTKANTMDRTKILAALKKAGVELADDASDEVILAAFSNLKPATEDAHADPGAADEVKALRAQLDSERRVRVTAEVKRRGENKIENKNLKWWVDQAMVDEAGVLAQIDGLSAVRPGGEPIGISASNVLDNRVTEIKKETNPVKRFAMLRAEWDGLIQQSLLDEQRRGLSTMVGSGGNQRLYPVASNTYSATLVTQFLLDGAVTKLQNRLSPLRVFSKDYSTDRYKPRATGQLKFVTAGGTTQKNASNFEAGDATVTNVQIAVDQYSTAFHVTNDELNSGLRMENLVDIKTAECGDNILKVAFAPLALAAFTTNAAIVRAPAAFSFSDMADAWGKLKKSPLKYAVLDGEYMARIINTPVFYQATDAVSGDGWKRFGWDGVHLNTNWTGTAGGDDDEFIRGLFCNPQAIGAISGLPLTPPTIPGSTLQESTISVPEVDISLASYSWFSLATRTLWMSYDLMFGSALLDESAGVLLTSQ